MQRLPFLQAKTGLRNSQKIQTEERAHQLRLVHSQLAKALISVW